MNNRVSNAFAFILFSAEFSSVLGAVSCYSLQSLCFLKIKT
ncbi:hypothetical protein HJ01_02709 [Flavobacterium frigoris PS1]|uniref:Uncharacterized protein n=1 Tax=Flavobacterium frigoris (strain PS1) TaxID=1086011 RepID=H7FUG5_FLAFP|nr:hypothetical protein HJ01_02709 [Flavobacterium frigoris PS1]